MHSLLSVSGLLTGLLFSTLTGASPSILEQVEPRAPGACHTATNRACWSDGFDINTDYERFTPEGTLRTFTWDITEHNDWTGPDGVVKDKVMLVNGVFPGPTLEADWGDTIEVTIRNQLELNGTSIHWHGLRMVGNNINDGVNGVTECPIPPGSQKTYRFRARQYGTSWYHSHFSAQYGNGVFGTILIHGPASLPYDIDLGPYPISDYYYRTADEILHDTLTRPGAPASDNVLFNGKNINPNGPGGEYSTLTLTPGRRHRLRLINPSVENNYHVSIVGHNMTVIQTDFVPVNAFTTDSLFMAIGQRYDVTIDATEDVGNYWLNVTMYSQWNCGTSVNAFPAAIIHYDGAPDELPTEQGTRPADTVCLDNHNFSPVVPYTAPADPFVPNADNTLEMDFTIGNLVLWRIDGSSIKVNWSQPIIEYVMQGSNQFPSAENIVVVDEVDEWTYWVIENNSPLEHPMHLHGHDFLVLGASARNAGPFTAADKGQLDWDNPTRRDTTMVAANGWLVLAFLTDNPGAWLMHCHIAWHISGGLGVDFLERMSEQEALITTEQATEFEENCDAWRTFAVANGIQQPDSGLRRPPFTPPSGV
jgi:FtsP/CotA-like multicopper oxidase with cupredoxin domain